MFKTNNQISLLFASLTTLVVLIVMVVLKLNATVIFIIGVVTYLFVFLAYRFLLYVLVFKKLEIIWDRMQSLRANKSKVLLPDSAFGIDTISRELEALNREKAKEIDHLKEIEKYRKEFLGNVAHELRTPAFAVQGFIETLLNGAHEDEKLRARFLSNASRNIDVLTDMLEDLSTISRVENNKLEVNLTEFTIYSVLSESVENLEMAAQDRGIKMILRGALDAKVYADAQKIKQVFNNLISNSIKYGKDGGVTTISIFDGKNAVQIDVADNGIGIDKKDLPRIFERFYRADKSRSRRQGISTGLGLSIVKHFLDAHDQQITARSSLGQGTVFSFTLPKKVVSSSATVSEENAA
ncbi:MAG: sensor histidine kinase [Bacteroidetes bacterium]|nr:sensor histidine kinase [Bacteroidota bacterium]